VFFKRDLRAVFLFVVFAISRRSKEIENSVLQDKEYVATKGVLFEVELSDSVVLVSVALVVLESEVVVSLVSFEILAVEFSEVGSTVVLEGALIFESDSFGLFVVSSAVKAGSVLVVEVVVAVVVVVVIVVVMVLVVEVVVVVVAVLVVVVLVVVVVVLVVVVVVVTVVVFVEVVVLVVLSESVQGCIS